MRCVLQYHKKETETMATTVKVRMTYSDAVALANEFIEKFVVGKHEIAGSIRRKEDVIGDIDIITVDPLMKVTSRFTPDVTIVRGKYLKLDVDYKGVRVNIYYCKPTHWGSMMFYLTGPKNYTIAYRRMAASQGYSLNQYGLFDRAGNTIASKTEAEIYRALGLYPSFATTIAQ